MFQCILNFTKEPRGLISYLPTDHADEEGHEVDPVGEEGEEGDAANGLAVLQALLHLLHLRVDVKVRSAEEEKCLLGLVHLPLGEQEDGGAGHEDKADGHQGRRHDQEAGECLPGDKLSNLKRKKEVCQIPNSRTKPEKKTPKEAINCWRLARAPLRPGSTVSTV